MVLLRCRCASGGLPSIQALACTPRGRHCRARQFAERPNDLLWAVWLWQETPALGKLILSNIHKPGSGDDLDLWPASPDSRRQFQAVHGTGHLNISKDDRNVKAVFEDHDCFVCVGGFDNVEARVR